jgi:hypothetical protein
MVAVAAAGVGMGLFESGHRVQRLTTPAPPPMVREEVARERDNRRARPCSPPHIRDHSRPSRLV